MEAAATPFPREETTPPVTKMYFGAVRKSGEILRDNLRTKHYAGIWGGSQIANFLMADNFLLGDARRNQHWPQEQGDAEEAANNPRKWIRASVAERRSEILHCAQD
jgi:hypothetical protein